MIKFIKGIFIYSLILICIPSIAQKKQAQKKFGDISTEDFTPTAYAIDSSANAVVIFDIGSSKYEGDALGGFSVIYTRHRRVRLLNRNSFDLATINLSLYSNNNINETIESLEASTFNLENGKVETYKLDKNSIFKDKLDKNFSSRKFTLPNLKEGSIIEIKYALKSPYERYIRPWNFQGSSPVLWSEYEVTIPSFYDFVVLGNGYQPYALDEGKTGNESYNIMNPGRNANDRSENFTVSATTVIHKWGMKDVPALKSEDFTTTIDNHISKIEFQLSSEKWPNVPPKDHMKNWYSVSEQLMKDERFGEALGRNSGWLQDELKLITAGTATPLEAAKKIFEYIRDNVSCTSHNGIYLSNTLKKVFQNKNGNVADVNLLLTAALINQGLDATPVLLSTRDHGKVTPTYPIMSQLNYVVSEVKIDGRSYFLDASHNKLGFGKLDLSCYNGPARLINTKMPRLVNLAADSVSEVKLTNAFFINDEKKGFIGSITTTLGENESNRLREKLGKISKEDFFKEIKKGYSSEIELSEPEIESLKTYEEPVQVKYNLAIEAKEDLIYLNPVFGQAYKENPFKAAERIYPVEMPYAMNENYVLRMEVPKGYTVEELPKSTKVSFNENEGIFEYLVSKDGDVIQLRSTIKLKKATFETEDYQGLRNFFAYIVKKHSEQIVLKKIK